MYTRNFKGIRKKFLHKAFQGLLSSEYFKSYFWAFKVLLKSWETYLTLTYIHVTTKYKICS